MPSAQQLPPDHPQRMELSNEIHARPPEALTAPERATYVAVMVGREHREREHAHLVSLCQHFGVAPPDPEVNHFRAELGELRVKWERHTEFSGYAFFIGGHSDQPFEAPASALLPQGWLAAVPGRTMVAVHTFVSQCTQPSAWSSAVERYFTKHGVVGAEIGDG